MTKISPTYYFERLIETIQSWYYWFSTPYADLKKHSGSYHPSRVNWGVIKDNKIISNFWYMVNDGYYDNMEEFFDRKKIESINTLKDT